MNSKSEPITIAVTLSPTGVQILRTELHEPNLDLAEHLARSYLNEIKVIGKEKVEVTVNYSITYSE